jgi:hypothetical protein
VFVHGNVQNLWYDPARLVISDPYNRTMGWDGAVSKMAEGRAIGCFDKARSQRRTAGGSFYYVDKATGGLTLEYGTLNFIPRMVGALGNGPTDPFVVKIKDWGASGPQNLTGYPSGVAVKQSIDAVLFKGDPHPELGYTQPFRFIRFEMLTPEFGNGVYSHEIGTTCAPGNLTDNDFHSGYANLIRLEANRGGLPYQNVNALWQIEMRGDFTDRFLSRGRLLHTTYDPEDSPGPTLADRSYGHVLRLAEGTVLTDTVNLLDTNTATGPGTWTNVSAKIVKTESGKSLYPRANVIRDTYVAGMVDLGPYAAGTVIDNVDFRPGGLRTIVRVNGSSSLKISRICALPGSKITGTGTVTLNGKAITLPYTIAAGSGCLL